MNETTSKKEKVKTLKKRIVYTIAFCWIFYRLFFLRSDKGLQNFRYCFKDLILTDYLKHITDYLSQNLQVRDYVLILGSKLLDAVLPTYMVYFIFGGVSWHSVLVFALFYNIRGPLIQNLSGLEYYDTYLFGIPGYFSFSVPYFRAPDFFFSGHAGCAIACAFMFKKWGFNLLFYFAVLVGFVEGALMIVLRTHYFIDVIFGLIAGHYFFIWARVVAIPLDYFLPLSDEQRRINAENKRKRAEYSKLKEENKIKRE